jgi:hypothetical protein
MAETGMNTVALEDVWTDGCTIDHWWVCWGWMGDGSWKRDSGLVLTITHDGDE